MLVSQGMWCNYRLHPNKVQLRPITQQKMSGGPMEGGSRMRERRKTLPSELLQSDIDKIRQSNNLPRELHPLAFRMTFT